jgi:hypothetical protein
VGATALADAIARIESRYGTRAVVRGDVAERQDGERRIEARTALALSVAAAAQREGGMAAWIDASASLDPLAALRAGVDLDRLVVIRVSSADDVLLAGSAALRSEGFRLVVVDLGPSFASCCRVDDLAPLLPVVRGSPAALVVVAEERGRRLALPTIRVEKVAWQLRFGRTVGWSFAAGTPASSERALFCIGALDAAPRDLGTRTALADTLEAAS